MYMHQPPPRPYSLTRQLPTNLMVTQKPPKPLNLQALTPKFERPYETPDPKPKNPEPLTLKTLSLKP